MAKFWVEALQRDGQVIAYAVRTTTPHVSGIADGIITIQRFDTDKGKAGAEHAANQLRNHLNGDIK